MWLRNHENEIMIKDHIRSSFLFLFRWNYDPCYSTSLVQGWYRILTDKDDGWNFPLLLLVTMVGEDKFSTDKSELSLEAKDKMVDRRQRQRRRGSYCSFKRRPARNTNKYLPPNNLCLRLRRQRRTVLVRFPYDPCFVADVFGRLSDADVRLF